MNSKTIKAPVSRKSAGQKEVERKNEYWYRTMQEPDEKPSKGIMHCRVTSVFSI